MSAAAVIRTDASAFVETSVTIPSVAVPASADDRLCDLIHDLRQPLSSMEAIAYYLEMTLPAEQVNVRQQMVELQRLVAEASEMLQRAAAAERKGIARAVSIR